jgi:hypothetical protein
MTENQPKVTIKYFAKDDPSMRTQDHKSMRTAVAVANLLLAYGGYTIISIEMVDQNDNV